MAEADAFNTAMGKTQETAMGLSPTPSERVAALYETHRLAIYRFLAAQGLDTGVAQDLTQDVFVKLFVAIDRGTEIMSAQAWLYGVASKSAVDYWRREGRPMWVELDAIPALADILPSKDLTPEIQSAREALRAEAVKQTEQNLGGRVLKDSSVTFDCTCQSCKPNTYRKGSPAGP